MRVGGTVVSAGALIFLGPASEFAIGHHERRIPALDFLHRAAHRDETLGEFFQQALLRALLVAMSIEAVVRYLDRCNPGFARDHLRSSFHRITELMVRKFGAKSVIRLERGCRLLHVLLDFEQMVQRGIARSGLSA